MSTVVLRVEASFGTLVRPGDLVKKGERIGIDPSFKSWVTSPVSGRVSSVRFDTDNHCFIVEIVEIK